MSKEKINKLKAMAGKAWQHENGPQYQFLSVNVKKDMITIATDGEWLETTVYDITTFMEKFREIASKELPALKTNGQVEIVSQAVPQSSMEKLSTVLMDNIEKLKKDPGYIGQAKEINNSVNAIVNLAKLEIMLKTPKR